MGGEREQISRDEEQGRNADRSKKMRKMQEKIFQIEFTLSAFRLR